MPACACQGKDNYCRIQSGVSFQLARNTNRKLEAYATYFLNVAYFVAARRLLRSGTALAS